MLISFIQKKHSFLRKREDDALACYGHGGHRTCSLTATTTTTNATTMEICGIFEWHFLLILFCPHVSWAFAFFSLTNDFLGRCIILPVNQRMLLLFLGRWHVVAICTVSPLLGTKVCTKMCLEKGKWICLFQQSAHSLKSRHLINTVVFFSTY